MLRQLFTLVTVLLCASLVLSAALFVVPGASQAENEATAGSSSDTPASEEERSSSDRTQNQSVSKAQYANEDVERGRRESRRAVDPPGESGDASAEDTPAEGDSATPYYDFYDRWLAREGDSPKVVPAKDAPSEGSAPGVRAPERSLALMEPPTRYSQVVDNAQPRRFLSPRGWRERPEAEISRRAKPYGEDFEYTRPAKDAPPARFKVEVPEDGFYTVYARWSAARGNNPATRFRISTASGLKRVEVNQRRDGDVWVRLGSYKLGAGDGSYVQVAGRSESKGRIVADAVMVVRGTQSPPQPDAGREGASGESAGGQTPIRGDAEGAEVVERARTHIGTPYRHSPPMPCEAYRSEDCSCLTKLVYGEWATLADDPVQQWGVGRSVERSDLQPGDLVFFKEAGRSNPITHVGIYSGSGNIIHSSTFWGQVVERPLSSVSGYFGARRLDR